MSDIQSRRKETIVFSWECPRCGYRTGEYTGGSWVEYYKEKHEPVCARAAELGLEPVFRDDFLHGFSERIEGWKRISDGAVMETHTGCERWTEPRPATEEEWREWGYTAEEVAEYGIPTTRDLYMVWELRFVKDGNWQHPIEVYDVPPDWDWAKPGAVTPWIEKEE